MIKLFISKRHSSLFLIISGLIIIKIFFPGIQISWLAWKFLSQVYKKSIKYLNGIADEEKKMELDHSFIKESLIVDFKNSYYEEGD